MLYYKTFPSITVLVTVPLLTLLMSLLSLGVSLILSSINVRFRDVANVLPYLIQLGLFLTPVTYPLSRIPERFKVYMTLNPMTGIIEGYKSAFLGNPWNYEALGISISVTVVALIFGIYFFNRAESTFADIV